MSDEESEEAEVNVVQNSQGEEDLETAPERKSNCPACGAEATDTSIVEHRLSNMGYFHDDQHFECSECDHSYTHGVPVGEPDVDADDLWCDVCDLGFMNVHRTQFKGDGIVRLHLKCGHHHDFDCPECGEEIAADGVRLTKEGGYYCPSCEEDLERDEIPFCHYFNTTIRKADARKRALVGYPMLTGRTDGAQNLGYPGE